jgi:hypothetical protein
MDIGLWLKDWSTPLSALATFIAVIVALGIGVASILYSQRLQRKERKEKLLNEVIEWAREITKHRFEKSLKELLQVTDSAGHTSYKKSLQFVHADIVEYKEIFASLEIQSHYVIKITLSFGAELHNIAQTLRGEINEYVNYLDNWQKILSHEIEYQKKDVDIVSGAAKSDEIARRMDKSAQKLLEEAARIKANL